MAIAPFGLDHYVSHTLPGWAQRSLFTDNVVTVDEFAEQAADIAEVLAFVSYILFHCSI